MNRKILASIIVFTLAFGSPIQVLALQKASRNALTFFKRYESEFGNMQRRLEEYNRRLQQVDGFRAEDIRLDAEDLMEQVQRRYDLLEDQYSATLSDYPQDGAQLREGFGRIDDGYRKFRDYYNENFVEKKAIKTSSKPKAKVDEKPRAQVVKVAPTSTEPIKDKGYLEALAALKRTPGASTVAAVKEPAPRPEPVIEAKSDKAYLEALSVLKRTPKTEEPVAVAVKEVVTKPIEEIQVKAEPVVQAKTTDKAYLEALSVLKRAPKVEEPVVAAVKEVAPKAPATPEPVAEPKRDKYFLETLLASKAAPTKVETVVSIEEKPEVVSEQASAVKSLSLPKEARVEDPKFLEALQVLKREDKKDDGSKAYAERIEAKKIEMIQKAEAAKKKEELEQQEKLRAQKEASALMLAELKLKVEREELEEREEKARLEAERLAKLEAELKKELEAELKAKWEAERLAQQKAEERAAERAAERAEIIRIEKERAQQRAGRTLPVKTATTAAAMVADNALAKANTFAATVATVASKAPASKKGDTGDYKAALAVLKRDPVKSKAMDKAIYVESDDALVVAAVPEARREIRAEVKPELKKDIDEVLESTMDITDALRAIEAKQAAEAEKIRSARRAKALAEAEQARKEAEAELLKKQRENEKLLRRAALAKEDEGFGKVKMSGNIAFEIRDKEEKTKGQNLVGVPTGQTILPNDLSQLRLTLNYQTDENHKFTLDERYLQRERNEKVRENYLTMAYMMKEDDEKVWNIKNTFQTTTYPDAISKDYRDNNFEVYLNRFTHNRESLTSLGYQVRSYQNYDRANFHQFALSNQETWFAKDGIMFAEGKLESRKYRVVNDLDYDNANLYFEYNKSYDNDAELTVSNSYDRRLYDKEATNLYRTSYYDNFLRLAYTLPMHSVLTYVFEAQHNKHEYGADKDRGYSELDLFVATKMKLTQKTRAQLDYRFIDNDENSRNLAHKNNLVHLMVQKNVNEVLRFRLDHTYHNRDTVIGKSMNFDNNESLARLMWRLNNMNVTWNLGFTSRIHDETSYVDYKYYHTGLDITYRRPDKFEWRIRPSVRKMEFRNFYQQNKLDPIKRWEDEIQPSIEVEYMKPLKEDLKLTLTASHEKTFYRTYDSYMQDLLWNFAKPMVNTEIRGKIEQSF